MKNPLASRNVMMIAGSVLALGMIPLTLAWQPAPSQPTQPGQQPVQPGQQPGQPNQPGQNNPPQQPGQTNPDSPSTPRTPGTPLDPNQVNPNNNDPRNVSPPNQNGTTQNGRLFSFQNPADEARFNQGAQRLVRMEEKMNESNQALLKRLGEVRAMAPERQTAATMDLLQQILRNQTEMNQYLVNQRSLWTGDVQMPGDENGSQRDGTQPGQTDPNNLTRPMQPRIPSNTSPRPSQPANTPPR
ncbi:MAG: hypothetical protein WC718_03665 [Phycisphaerales bacterium]|jgi:hypothetical protein